MLGVREAVERFTRPRLACAVGLVFLVSFPGAAAAPTVLTYEAAGAEVPVGGGYVRSPEFNTWDPSGGAASWDGRIDVGRLVVDVPPGSATLQFTVQDVTYARVPVRLETFKSNGAKASEAAFCMTPGLDASIPVNGGVRVAVFRVSAVNLSDVCEGDVAAGATRGTVTVTFR